MTTFDLKSQSYGIKSHKFGEIKRFEEKGKVSEIESQNSK